MLLGVIVLSVLLNGIGVSLLGLKFGLPLQTEVGARGVGSRVAAEPCLGPIPAVSPMASGVLLTPLNFGRQSRRGGERACEQLFQRVVRGLVYY